MTNDPLIGQQLGAYRLDDLIGQGGMARIYRGTDTRLNRAVAIKVIDTPYQADAAYIERFRQEARTIARLTHPHIVRVYDFGEAQDVLYIVMEFIRGENLQQLLERHHSAGALLDTATVCTITRQICAALDHAHQHGVIHRDVKPANILRNDHGQMVLADFGLALQTNVGTQGKIFGTPHYMAPEQAISSANAVPQSDLYAVGIMLYEMTTGHLPFDGGDALGVAMRHLTEQPRPPRELRPDLPEAVEAVILKTLAKEPAARYPNGAALAGALESAFGIGGAPARRAARPAPPANAHNAPTTMNPPEVRPTQPVNINNAPTTVIPPEARPAAPVGIHNAPTTMNPPQPHSAPPAGIHNAPTTVIPPEARPAAPAGIHNAPTTMNPPQPLPASPVGIHNAATTMNPPAARAGAVQLPPPTGPITTAQHQQQAAQPAAAPSRQRRTLLGGAAALALLLILGVFVLGRGSDGDETDPLSAAIARATEQAAGGPASQVDQPEETPQPAGDEQPTQAVATQPSYSLMIVRQDAEHLLVTNTSAVPLPLSALQLGDGAAVQWPAAQLDPGACVALGEYGGKGNGKGKGKGKNKSTSPCPLVVNAPLDEELGEDTFFIYFESTPVGACEESAGQCQVTIAPDAR